MKIYFTYVAMLLAATLCSCSKKDKVNPQPTKPDTTATPPAKSDANSITVFNLDSFSPAVVGNVKTNDSITFPLPVNAGTDPGLIKSSITYSAKASISPLPGIAQDFTKAVTYTVTSESGKTRVYYAKATPPVSPKSKPIPPAYLCLYYGIPVLVNGSTNASQAAAVFAKFDVVVFGNHLNDGSNTYYASTVAVISALKALKPAIKIFGYVDVGNTESLSPAALNVSIDSWHTMGATGVFGDEFGYDYTINNRGRQNGFIDHAHGLSMNVFANAFRVADALGDDAGKTHLVKGDFCLIENLLVSNGTLQPFADYGTRGALFYYYMRTTGVSIAVVSTIPLSAISASSNTTDAFKYSWCGTAMYNFDAFQFTDINYSASLSVVNFYPNFATSYGSSWSDYDWVKMPSSTTYSRSTDTKTIQITSDGKGKITP